MHLLDSAPTVSIPGAWYRSTSLPYIATSVECATALRECGPVLRQAICSASKSDAVAFHRDVHRELTGHRAHVMISYPEELPAATAAALLAAWFGLSGRAIHEDLGGTVSRVVSGAGHRHDQAWHSDSTPWAVPNRFSILGLLTEPTGVSTSTDIIPIAALESVLMGDQTALSALRTEAIEWRRNFIDLPPLQGAILDPSAPRWVWPAIEDSFDTLTDELQEAITALLAALGCAPRYSPLVRPGELLVFDNQRALHRGPALEVSAGRELVRIKIGGRALG